MSDAAGNGKNDPGGALAAALLPSSCGGSASGGDGDPVSVGNTANGAADVSRFMDWMDWDSSMEVK